MELKARIAFINLIKADRVLWDFEGENGEKYYHFCNTFFMRDCVVVSDRGDQVPVVVTITREDTIKAYKRCVSTLFWKETEAIRKKYGIAPTKYTLELPEYLKKGGPDDIF